MTTIEAIEALAAELTAAGEAERARLARLVRALARIAAARSPDAFGRRALLQCDEPGHWDTSFPPRTVYTDRRGPLSVRTHGIRYDDIPTSGGFYHRFRRETLRPGYAITPDGDILAGTLAGTGRVGQYAAHPGDCDVECVIEWSRIDPLDREMISVALLGEVADAIRTLAFPPVAGPGAGELP